MIGAKSTLNGSILEFGRTNVVRMTSPLKSLTSRCASCMFQIRPPVPMRNQLSFLVMILKKEIVANDLQSRIRSSLLLTKSLRAWLKRFPPIGLSKLLQRRPSKRKRKSRQMKSQGLKLLMQLRMIPRRLLLTSTQALLLTSTLSAKQMRLHLKLMLKKRRMQTFQPLKPRKKRMKAHQLLKLKKKRRQALQQLRPKKRRRLAAPLLKQRKMPKQMKPRQRFPPQLMLMTSQSRSPQQTMMQILIQWLMVLVQKIKSERNGR